MKIVIAAGGTGGHMFPALSVAQKLREDDHRVEFLTTGGLAENILLKHGYDFHLIKARGVSLASPVRAVRSVVTMAVAVVSAMRILEKSRPRVVVGFGGYGSFPVVLAAWMLKIPTVIHEQNVVPGRANCLLSKFVSTVAVSFENSLSCFPKDKTIFTGCPLRDRNPGLRKSEIYRRFNLDERKKTILVLGGSQGSQKINREVLKTAAALEGQGDLQFIHITGEQDYFTVSKAYKALRAPHAVFYFLQDMALAYQVADVVVARSGAMTVFELMAFGRSAILVPYPAKHVHQKENALVLENAGVARVIDDNELCAAWLKDAILSLLADPIAPEEFAKRVEPFYRPDAAARVAKEIEKLL